MRAVIAGAEATGAGAFKYATPDIEFDNTRDLGEWRGVHTGRDQAMPNASEGKVNAVEPRRKGRTAGFFGMKRTRTGRSFKAGRTSGGTFKTRKGRRVVGISGKEEEVGALPNHLPLRLAAL